MPVSGYRRFDANAIARLAEEMRSQFAPADEGSPIPYSGPRAIVYGDLD
jgi:hypothetical protein